MTIRELFRKQKYGIFDAYKKNHEDLFAFSQMNAAHCIGAKKQKVIIN